MYVCVYVVTVYYIQTVYIVYVILFVYVSYTRLCMLAIHVYTKIHCIHADLSVFYSMQTQIFPYQIKTTSSNNIWAGTRGPMHRSECSIVWR